MNESKLLQARRRGLEGYRRGPSCAPIKGASFTFRTLHGPDGRFGERARGPRVTTLDRLITITLPAIDGEGHKMVPHMEVIL